jgi:hypothetical protein
MYDIPGSVINLHFVLPYHLCMLSIVMYLKMYQLTNSAHLGRLYTFYFLNIVQNCNASLDQCETLHTHSKIKIAPGHLLYILNSAKKKRPFSGHCLSKIIRKNQNNFTDLHCKGFEHCFPCMFN